VTFPIQPITEKALNRLKLTQMNVGVDPYAYSEIWQTPEGHVLKLFTGHSESDDENIQRDINTLITIMSYRDKLDDRFVKPITLFEKKDQIIGYLMPYTKGTHLSALLQTLPWDQAKRIFANIYQDICYLRSLSGKFAFGDLHEDNILVHNNKLTHIDIDGWYIGDGCGRRSRYMEYKWGNAAEIPYRFNIPQRKPKST